MTGNDLLKMLQSIPEEDLNLPVFLHLEGAEDIERMVAPEEGKVPNVMVRDKSKPNRDYDFIDPRFYEEYHAPGVKTSHPFEYIEETRILIISSSQIYSE